MEPVGDLDVSKLILEKRLLTVDELFEQLSDVVKDHEAAYSGPHSRSWWMYAQRDREPLNGPSKLLLVKLPDGDLTEQEFAKASTIAVEDRSFRLACDILILEDIVFHHSHAFGSVCGDSLAQSIEYYLQNDAFRQAS